LTCARFREPPGGDASPPFLRGFTRSSGGIEDEAGSPKRPQAALEESSLAQTPPKSKPPPCSPPSSGSARGSTGSTGLRSTGSTGSAGQPTTPTRRGLRDNCTELYHQSTPEVQTHYHPLLYSGGSTPSGVTPSTTPGHRYGSDTSCPASSNKACPQFNNRGGTPIGSHQLGGQNYGTPLPYRTYFAHTPGGGICATSGGGSSQTSGPSVQCYFGISPPCPPGPMMLSPNTFLPPCRPGPHIMTPVAPPLPNLSNCYGTPSQRHSGGHGLTPGPTSRPSAEEYCVAGYAHQAFFAQLQHDQC